MNRCILWIEDDYYAIRGLMRLLEKADIRVESAVSAYDGYTKAQRWQSYDMIVVDLILPLDNGQRKLPPEVREWNREEYVGIGLIKWLRKDLKVECPILILSVVDDPIVKFQLQDLHLAGHLPKGELLPIRVKEEVLSLLGIEG